MEMSSRVLLLFLYLNSGFVPISSPDGETRSGALSHSTGSARDI